MSGKKPVVGIVLFCLACLLALLLITPLLLPGTVIDAVDGEAQVYIETDRAWVAFPWECYTISWAVFGTTSVYLDGGGVIGEFTRPECIDWRNAPSFERNHVYTINKADGTSRDFPFTQRVLVGRAEFWLGLIVLGALLFEADRLGGTPRHWLWLRRRLLTLPNARVSLLPERISTRRQKLLVAGALVVIYTAGLLLRLNYVYMLGENNYLAWSYQNYYGGISSTYVMLSGITGVEVPQQTRDIYPMGYPSMLSVTHSAGLDYTGVRVLQAILDTLSIVPLFLILRRLRLSLWASLLGALMYALYPILVVGSVILLAEWIAPPLMIWIIYTLLRAVDSTKWWAWLVPGLLLGLLSLFRPEALLIVGVAGLWLLWQRWSWRRTLVGACVMGIGFAVFTGIAGLNNLRLTGRFSIASSAGGYALWAGLGMIPNDYGYFVDDARAIQMLATMGIRFHTPESNQYFMGEYLTAWRERPMYVLSTFGLRWFRILSEQDTFVLYSTRNSAYPDALSLPLLVQSVWWWLLPVACVISYRQKKRLFALLFPLLAAMLTIGLVYFETRYVRYTVISYLFAAVITLDWLVNNIRQAVHYSFPRWKQSVVNIALSGLVIAAAVYISVVQFPLLTSQIAAEQQANTARAAFSPENHTPRYTMSEMNMYIEGDNVRLEPERGWLIGTSSWGGLGLWQATIPLQGERTISVRLEVELVAGSGYIALIGDVERDQVLLQAPGIHTVDLTSYTADLDAITIKIITHNYVPNALLRVESIDVYLEP